MIKDREKKTTSNRFHRLCCCLSFRITGRCALPLLVTGVGSWRGGGGRGASPVGGEICRFGLPAFCRVLCCFVF